MSLSRQTKVTFLGTSRAVPDEGCDTVSFVINDRYAVDTGWSIVGNMRKFGIDPLHIEYLLFTHFHHDHYLSLPQLLFYWLMKGKPLTELKIIGPAEDAERIVRLSLSFLQAEEYFVKDGTPTIIPLTPGESYEDDQFKIDTCGTKHPVQGLCYRFTDKLTGKWFSFTGDTAYHEPIIDFVKGSPLLIHEAAMGPVEADPLKNSYMHSGAIDAAKAAQASDAGKLLLVHGTAEKAEESIQAAKQYFSKEIIWPKAGQTFEI